MNHANLIKLYWSRKSNSFVKVCELGIMDRANCEMNWVTYYELANLEGPLILNIDFEYELDELNELLIIYGINM